MLGAERAHWTFHSGNDVTTRNVTNDVGCPWFSPQHFSSCSCWMMQVPILLLCSSICYLLLCSYAFTFFIGKKNHSFIIENLAIVNCSSYAKRIFFYIVEITGFMYTKQVLLSSNPNTCLLIFVLRESKWPHLYLNWLCTPGKLSNCVLSALPFQLGKFKTVLFCSKIVNHSWLPILKSSIISTNIHELLNTNFSCYQIEYLLRT